MLQYSKYNIFSKIKNTEKYFILNQLSGNADILNAEEARKISLISDKNKFADEELENELLSKGYLSDPDDEKKLFTTKYLDFLDSRETDEIQIFFVTNYSCNFSCSYCYQDQYINSGTPLNEDIINSFFDYIRKEFAGRKKYITVFGGEPLLPDPGHRELIDFFITRANSDNLSLCFVTNGYTLSSYLDSLSKGTIREIQVTLDGTPDVHNNRRHLKGGAGTFDKIVEGIDKCLGKNIPVNLRMVIDKENINNLPELAKLAIDKGWTDNPKFKTQFGRNYELHHCQSSPDKLFSRISLYENISEQISKYPWILEFHKPAYSVAKFLSENGTLPEPLFDSCPACKTEWAFDYTGKIYSCTATVGKSDECLGTFYPENTLNRELVENWQNRDVTTIPECRNCNLQLACGGGCGSISKNRNGSICSPDCRPVKELLELGFSLYLE
ncbi:MAG TPA: radical SAM protein [Bacteroidales bacterium]|nr:radical SAM protein [Bacteroidales bacterium]